MISFSAGDLVLVPRSKGGMSYGVLATSQDDKGRIVWNVEGGTSVCLDLKYVFKGHVTRRQRAYSMQCGSRHIRISGPQMRVLTLNTCIDLKYVYCPLTRPERTIASMQGLNTYLSSKYFFKV